MKTRNETAAERAREIGRGVADRVYEKQLAYGDSASIATGLWEARLRQYLSPDGRHYVIPVELARHFPRITRLDDRINRIVSNPAGDRLGESPWLDAAGDCVVGALVAEGPPPGAPGAGGCFDPECEREADHNGPHRRVHAGGTSEWVTYRLKPCPEGDCILTVDHIGPHLLGRPQVWEEAEDAGHEERGI